MKMREVRHGRCAWVVVVAAAALSACSSGPFASRAPLGLSGAPVGGACSAQAAQAVIGKSAVAQVVEQARVAAGARMARVLHPGQMITKEFDGERLNLEVDARGVIVAVRCG